MIDQEFLQRCEEFAKPHVKEYLENRRERNRKCVKNNPEKQKASQAICDIRRRLKKYLSKIILKEKEKKEISIFYKNCPQGCEVDHIIPISKGGTHTIENLQYLTKAENREKSNKWIGVNQGEFYDPNFLLKRLDEELDENEKLDIGLIVLEY